MFYWDVTPSSLAVTLSEKPPTSIFRVDVRISTDDSEEAAASTFRVE
jgi:hypothetical protein